MRTRKDSAAAPPGAPVDAVLSRDRGRLLRLRSAAARAPDDAAAHAAFADALAASRAAVAARAAAMPVPTFDASLMGGQGNREQTLEVYRRVRDQLFERIKRRFGFEGGPSV